MNRSVLTPLVVRVGYSSLDDFLRGERDRISALGILLREGGRVAMGERVLLRVELENGERAIVAEGVARSAPEALTGEQGQWIQFRRFDTATKTLMVSAIESGLLQKSPLRAASPGVKKTSERPRPSLRPSLTPPAVPFAPAIAAPAPAGEPALEDSGVRSRPSLPAYVPPSPEKRDSLLAKLRQRSMLPPPPASSDTPATQEDPPGQRANQA